MRVEEIRTASGRPVAMVFPYPFPSAVLTDSVRQSFASQAHTFGFPYVVLMTRDEVEGRDSSGARVFALPTANLRPYARTDRELSDGWVDEYANIARKWLTALQWQARAHGETAVAERVLPPAFLQLLRSEEQHVSL